MKQGLVVISFLGLAACAGSQSSVESTSPSPTSAPLVANMQNLKMSIEGLLPILVDSKAYNNPKQQEQLRTRVRELDQDAQKVTHDPVKGKMDPSFGFLSEGFSQETRRAREAIEAGKTDFARYTLLNLSSYCIECHTRTSAGPAFGSKIIDEKLSDLDPLDRAEYLLATRRFDLALDEFSKMIRAKKTSPVQFLAVERAVRHSMAITVKFQKSPQKTEKLIADIESSEVVPFYLKQAATHWRKSVARWKAERPSTRNGLADRIKRAEDQVRVGLQAQVGISDRSGDVELLRALSELHQILLQNLNQDQMSSVLYATGEAYEAVGDFSLWNIHEQYYEACIRKHPHSSWARKCYTSLEESVIQGYTGSSGTAVPMDEQMRLKDLARLAEPEVQTR